MMMLIVILQQRAHWAPCLLFYQEEFNMNPTNDVAHFRGYRELISSSSVSSTLAPQRNHPSADPLSSIVYEFEENPLHTT